MLSTLRPCMARTSPTAKEATATRVKDFTPRWYIWAITSRTNQGGWSRLRHESSTKEEQVPHVIDEGHRLMAGPIKQALFHQPRPMQPSRTEKICPGNLTSDAAPWVTTC